MAIIVIINNPPTMCMPGGSKEYNILFATTRHTLLNSY